MGFIWVVAGPSQAQPVFDPICQDPVEFDAAYPATMNQVEITSHGAALFGLLYIAQGQGPHPTVLLLHGYPGNEKSFDLAQIIRRAGWNVLVFHYRGSWSSEGDYSFSNCLKDTEVALAFLRNEEAAQTHRVKTDEIVVMGHSLGGFLALMIAQTDERVRSVCSISGVNFAHVVAEDGLDSPEGFEETAQALDKEIAMLSGTSGEAAVREIVENAESWNLLAYADRLAAKKVLLIGASRDESVPVDPHHTTLVEALQNEGAEDLTHVILESDHVFSDRRVELARVILSWLAEQ